MLYNAYSIFHILSPPISHLAPERLQSLGAILFITRPTRCPRITRVRKFLPGTRQKRQSKQLEAIITGNFKGPTGDKGAHG